MKKKLFFGVGIVALLGIVFWVFRIHPNYRDVLISSEDGKVTLVFEQVTVKETEEWPAYFTTYFTPLSADTFFEDYLVGQEYYVCSLNDRMERTDGETGFYLLMKENHCFFVQVEGKKVSVQEMISAYYPPDYYCAPIFSVPFLETALPHSKKEWILWEDIILADDWAELIDFYDSIHWNYKLDGDVLYLSLYEIYSPEEREIWYDGAVKITEFSDGIEIELIKDGLPTREW